MGLNDLKCTCSSHVHYHKCPIPLYPSLVYELFFHVFNCAPFWPALTVYTRNGASEQYQAPAFRRSGLALQTVLFGIHETVIAPRHYIGCYFWKASPLSYSLILVFKAPSQLRTGCLTHQICLQNRIVQKPKTYSPLQTLILWMAL